VSRDLAEFAHQVGATSLFRADALSNLSAASAVEQWAENKAVHYNERANFGEKYFHVGCHPV